MYITELELENFKCFGQAKVEFRYPGDGKPRHDNINVVLGDNGSGKSALLRAVALGVMAPVLQVSGLVSSWFIRRPDCMSAQLKANLIESNALNRAHVTQNSFDAELGLGQHYEFSTKFLRRKNFSQELLEFSNLSDNLQEILFWEGNEENFLVGYGSKRKIETGEYSESKRLKERGLAYELLAGLFEDQHTLRPVGLLLDLYNHRKKEIDELFSLLLPDQIRVKIPNDAQHELDIRSHGVDMPANILSDGYLSFLGWVSDLICRMCDYCPANEAIRNMTGIVLVDEIDLHLHPQWQRNVIPSLAKALPNMQFIVTTHSPIVLSSVRRENVFICERQADGTATVSNPKEKTFGRGVEQLLMSGYFGLTSTRTDGFMQAANVLFDDAASGDADAALAYLEQLAKPPSDIEELSEKFADAKLRAERSGR